jgi:hypothetical protein
VKFLISLACSAEHYYERGLFAVCATPHGHLEENKPPSISRRSFLSRAENPAGRSRAPPWIPAPASPPALLQASHGLEPEWWAAGKHLANDQQKPGRTPFPLLPMIFPDLFPRHTLPDPRDPAPFSPSHLIIQRQHKPRLQRHVVCRAPTRAGRARFLTAPSVPLGRSAAP